MQTIRLRVNDKVYKNLMWFLGRFTNEEIQVVKETDQFISVQEYLSSELEKIENGTAEFESIDQLDEELEHTLRKY
ncbi:MAG: hypothetical protein K9H64_14665 [Bacteroidales bacterium]|nr:hypothetical protein [Bacteroidales bacterium]MCF8457183.1 hypothetical protein [Bacteroidales bacterium]